MNKFIGIIMIFACTGVACFIFFLTAKSIYRFYLDAGSWAETKGVILEVNIELQGSSSTNTFGHHSSDAFYIPKPKYEFWVGSERYVSDCYQVGAVSTFESEQEVRALFNVGGEVTVYYNPQNPNEAILSKGQSASTIIFFGLFAFMLLGTAFYIYRVFF